MLKIYQNIKWEDKEFLVEIRSYSKINDFTFDQPTKSISFDLMDENQYVTLIIPLELLWNPYQVFLDDQKILKHENFQNETHAWLNVKPPTSGTITIVGTSVIPEFSLFTPLVLGLVIVIVFRFKNKTCTICPGHASAGTRIIYCPACRWRKSRAGGPRK